MKGRFTKTHTLLSGRCVCLGCCQYVHYPRTTKMPTTIFQNFLLGGQNKTGMILFFSGSRRASCSQTLSSKLSHTAVHSQSHSATQVKAADVRTPTDSFSFTILFSSATTNTRHTKAQRQQHTERQRRREQQAAC